MYLKVGLSVYIRYKWAHCDLNNLKLNTLRPLVASESANPRQIRPVLVSVFVQIMTMLEVPHMIKAIG